MIIKKFLGQGRHRDLLSPLDAYDQATSDYYPLTPDAKRAIEAIEYITDHLRQDEEYKMVSKSVKYVRK